LIKGGGELRWWLHRILAGIMVFTSFMHIYYAVFTNKGRKEVPHFLPKLQDLKDLLNMLAYNLDLKKERPTFGSHSYIEKAEYLALVWGTIVMVVTGTILMLQNLSLAYLPLDLINVATAIHMYEAILAGLAIIVWHFYFVMFDPDEYPMNWTWITGTLTPHQLEVRNGRKKVSHD
jgi:cytochrome b subunit of formate dehydrogenase